MSIRTLSLPLSMPSLPASSVWLRGSCRGSGMAFSSGSSSANRFRANDEQHGSTTQLKYLHPQVDRTLLPFLRSGRTFSRKEKSETRFQQFSTQACVENPRCQNHGEGDLKFRSNDFFSQSIYFYCFTCQNAKKIGDRGRK